MNQIVRTFGLPNGVRVRWYVEGHTEFGALDSALELYTTIEVINLGGQVTQGKGKGVAFRESLENDIKAQIFSLVSVDGDEEKYVRAVKQAAIDDKICGAVFVSYPDFETANFTTSEIEEILWDYAFANGTSISEKQILIDVIEGFDKDKLGKVLESAQKALPSLKQIGKGKEWGSMLMKYAHDHPISIETQATRPIIKAIKVALRAEKANYMKIRQRRTLQIREQLKQLEQETTAKRILAKRTQVKQNSQ